jgi:hypothetical protein
MRQKVFGIVIIASALTAVVVTAAHAGGGGLCQPGGGDVGGNCPIPPLVLFDCYATEENVEAPFVLSPIDQFGPHEGVRLRRARLLCTPTEPEPTVQRGPDINPDFLLRERAGGEPDHLSCFDVEPRNSKPTQIVKITDPFGTQTTRLRHLSIVCAPAFKDVIGP